MSEILSTILLILLILVIVTMSISIIVIVLRFNKQIMNQSEKIMNRSISNCSAIYKVYDAKNMDIRCVSFKSENSDFDVANAVYWVATHDVYKHYGLDRIIYLDEDEKKIYRPNHGKFDKAINWTVDNISYSSSIEITDFEIRDSIRKGTVKFKLIKNE